MTQTAVPMWPTPWYLRIFGYPAWRVKERYRSINSDPERRAWSWGYYEDIHDYAERNKPLPMPPPMPKKK